MTASGNDQSLRRQLSMSAPAAKLTVDCSGQVIAMNIGALFQGYELFSIKKDKSVPSVEEQTCSLFPISFKSIS